MMEQIMDTNASFNLETAEPQTCTSSTEPSQVLVHSLSLTEDISQLPLPATVTVSSDLVEDLIIRLMLRLNPLRSSSEARLDQQQLLTLCLHLSAVTLETLTTIPGVSVDGDLPPPSSCDTWRAAVLLQSSLMKRFGVSNQVRKQLVRKDPELLRFIPYHIIEAVLTTYRNKSADESTPSQTRSDEESQLFSQFLPVAVKEEMFERHGSWIRHTKVFLYAFPRITDEDILEFQQRISTPRLSNRDVVWVDKKYVLHDFYEETAADTSSQQLHNSEDQGLVSSIEVNCQKLPQLCLPQLMVGDSDTAKLRASLRESTIRSVLVELFKGRDRKPQDQKNQVFEHEMVEHIQLLLQKEAKKYKKNRVFLQNLKRLKDPKQELKLSREVSQPIKDTLYKALPDTWLSRQGLMKDVEIALVACSLIASEIMNHLKPTVSFTANTKPGDETPYSLNIPIKRHEPESEPEREPTQLELRLQEQRAQTRKQVFSAEAFTEPLTAPEPEEKHKKKKKKKKRKKKKKKKFFSELAKLAKCRKT